MANDLSFEKAEKLSKCWGKDDLILQYFDETKDSRGLLDETPMPIVLYIHKTKEGKIVFEQTEFTQKYIGIV
ncbi:MAG: hypothetical protein IJ192_14225 [Clostridia bacterium]|nr:hypothetical protein [Clostridia bacterium]